MKQILWVFGSSAAGKETFIKYIFANPNSEIASQLNWTHKKIKISQKSIDLIGQSDTDPVIDQRGEILDEVMELINDADIVLLKWQGVDSKLQRPERLKKLIPQADHEIIHLQVDKYELMQRLPKKKWWQDEFNLEGWAEGEPQEVQEMVNDLQNQHNFPVTNINSNKNEYQIILVS